MKQTGTATSTSTGTFQAHKIFPDGYEGPADMPFCKVCYDAGLPVADYTDHFVKDQPGPAGKVVCPTLLNQKCRICSKPGHTSSYCPNYRVGFHDRLRHHIHDVEPQKRMDRDHYHEEPRRDEPRDRREEPRSRREEPRHRREEPRREDRHRDISYNHLRSDTERHEREIDERNIMHERQQERQTKSWLQAALRQSPSSSYYQQRNSSSDHVADNRSRGPYAHPHGPRVRIDLETHALSAATASPPPPPPATFTTTASPGVVMDVLKIDLHHAAKWGDEDTAQQMAYEMFQDLEREGVECFMSREEDDFMAMCNSNGPSFSGECD